MAKCIRTREVSEGSTFFAVPSLHVRSDTSTAKDTVDYGFVTEAQEARKEAVRGQSPQAKVKRASCLKRERSCIDAAQAAPYAAILDQAFVLGWLRR